MSRIWFQDLVIQFEHLAMSSIQFEDLAMSSIQFEHFSVVKHSVEHLAMSSIQFEHFVAFSLNTWWCLTFNINDINFL